MLSHRKSRTIEYRIWCGMRFRCNNIAYRQFKDYGGRGISVCSRWSDFENFYADMGPRPSPEHSLDRIDVNGNYCPENCRWATQVEQQNNRTNSIRVSVDGRSLTVEEWSVVYAIPPKTIYARLGRGWEPSRAVTEQLHNNHGRG